MRGRDDPQVAAPTGLVSGKMIFIGTRRRRCGTGGLAYGVGQRDQVVGGGRWGREVTVVTDQVPASGGGEAAGVRLAEVVRVGFGERGERTDDGSGIAVDVGQRGDRLSGAAVAGAA